MNPEHMAVYYAVIDSATGVVVESGHCSRSMAHLQAREPGQEVVITSDTTEVDLQGVRHEEVKSGFVFAAPEKGSTLRKAYTAADYQRKIEAEGK